MQGIPCRTRLRAAQRAQVAGTAPRPCPTAGPRVVPRVVPARASPGPTRRAPPETKSPHIRIHSKHVK
jgi:hypothetical protein